MFCVENSQRITKYLLLSFLYFDSVFTATIETAQRLGDDEDEVIYTEYENEVIYTEYENEVIYTEYENEVINGEYVSEVNYGEDKNILRLDFFRFTTSKRYIWEDWTIPTRDPADYDDSISSTNFVLYIIVPILVVGIVGTLLYYCIKNLSENNCYSAEFHSHSSTSANRFTAVHQPHERRAGTFAQVHRPPTGRNNFSDLRRELLGEPSRTYLSNELNSNRSAADATEVAITFANSTYVSSSQGRREPDNTVAEKPPDYSTVTLSDLVNPTKAAFPVVKTDNETPPPEYGEENPFLK